jgi:hypothetical protein
VAAASAAADAQARVAALEAANRALEAARAALEGQLHEARDKARAAEAALEAGGRAGDAAAAEARRAGEAAAAEARRAGEAAAAEAERARSAAEQAAAVQREAAADLRRELEAGEAHAGGGGDRHGSKGLVRRRPAPALLLRCGPRARCGWLCWPAAGCTNGGSPIARTVNRRLAAECEAGRRADADAQAARCSLQAASEALAAARAEADELRERLRATEVGPASSALAPRRTDRRFC